MKDFEDALLDIGKDNLNLENKRYRDIDTKAISIVTICGILITLLINFVKVGGLYSKILFSLTTLSFLATVILGIYVIRPRPVGMLSTQNLIDFFQNQSDHAQITGVVATIADAETALAKINDLKTFELFKSVYALGISIILMIIYALSVFIFPLF
jgi:hypothetical protein